VAGLVSVTASPLPGLANAESVTIWPTRARRPFDASVDPTEVGRSRREDVGRTGFFVVFG